MTLTTHPLMIYIHKPERDRAADKNNMSHLEVALNRLSGRSIMTARWCLVVYWDVFASEKLLSALAVRDSVGEGLWSYRLEKVRPAESFNSICL